MLRSTASKVMWVGRATVFLVGLAVILALVLGVATAAFGANGDAWKLGQGSVATKITTLGGMLGVNGPMLRLINNNADADDTALELRVQTGEAPMRVNSDAMVANLNADKLDGQDSSSFADGTGGKATDADMLDGKDASEFVPTNTNAFVRNGTRRNESALGPGSTLGDGTQTMSASCDPGDVMLSGGPANIAPTTNVLESFPSSINSWTVRVNKNGGGDNYSVVVLCADQ
jgi:hypothetical protein